MARKKKIRTRGKVSLSRYFQEINKGDIVAVVKEPAIPSNFPDRMQGRTGVVESQKGRAFVIRIKDSNQEKKFIIQPIHLKKIKTTNIPK